MKNYGLFGFLGFISLSFVFALPARAEDTPRVFISEINWAGSQVSTADEWLELVNLGTTSVDLSHYVLTGVASSGGAIEIAEGTWLEAGQTLVIANYGLNDPKTSLLISPNLVTTAISLPNSALDILLTTPAGEVIDNYTDPGTLEFGATVPATSIERDLTTLAWQSSTQSLNLSSTSQLGTPGSVNLPPAAVPTTAPPAPEPTPVVEPEPVEMTAPPSIQPIQEGAPELPQPCPVPVEIPDSEAEPTAVPILDTPQTETPAPIDPVVPTEPTAPAVPSITPGELILNELVSDPTDGVEWVELLNVGSRVIDLSGSTLKDAGNHVTSLPAQTLAAGSFLVIDSPNGNLNNSGDSLTLLNAQGTELDTVTYGTADVPAPEDGASLARNSEDAWLITTATRNTANVFDIASADEGVAEPSLAPTSETPYDTVPTNVYDETTNATDAVSGDSGTAAEPVETLNDAGSPGTEPIHRIVAIAQSVGVGSTGSAKSTPTGGKSKTQSVITGTVVALPNTFGKQTLFLDGHEIYFNAANWPELELGDIVHLTGTESTSNGAPRLKISSADDILITGHADVIPTPIDGQELPSLAHGTFVSLAGRVLGKDGDKLSVQTDDGTTITVLANKKTGVSWSDIQSGTVIISGIVKHTDSGISVAVRTHDDVHYTPDSNAPAAAVIKPKSKASPLVGGGLLTGSVGALGTWYARSRKGLLSWLPF